MQTIQTHVIVVGAGAAGLLAAVAAKRLGNDVVLLEAADAVGGSTAVSSGVMWLPGNPLMGSGGLPADSVAEARAYLDAVLGDPDQVSTAARRDAFVRTAGMLARWLRSSKIKLAAVKPLPDEETGAPGAKSLGRALAVEPLERRLLGDLATGIRGVQTTGTTSLPVIGAVQRIAGRVLSRGEELAGGAALVGELLRRSDNSGVELWLNSPMTDLVTEDGRVVGVRVIREDAPVEVRASRGVVLACGGFEANPDLRGEFLPLPTDAAWTTSGVPTNLGIAITAGRAAGAALGGLDDAWWTPVMVADGVAHDLTAARCAPYSLIVDQAGDRYFDEAEGAVKAGRHLYDRNRGMRAVPSFLILDNRHRQRYPLGPWAAGSTPRRALDAGDIVKSATLNDLAQSLGVDRAGLIGSVVQYNTGAAKGRDPDFRRGQNAADKARGDATHRRNPCLGPVEKGPYWAVKVFPGDSGTKGGVLIDGDGRVLGENGSVIPGLYACGGAAASPITGGSPADGVALGVALVEAYRAVLSLADQLSRLDEATH